jgi:hypothetical protein
VRVRASGLQHTTHNVGRRDGVTSGGDQGETNCVAAADGVTVWGACTNVRALRGLVFLAGQVCVRVLGCC